MATKEWIQTHQKEMRAYRRKHYRANREQYYARNRKSWAAKQAFLDKLRDVPCPICKGRFAPCSMEFDHLRDKKTCVSTLAKNSWSKLKAEIAKCEVICANCHRVRTLNRKKDKTR